MCSYDHTRLDRNAHTVAAVQQHIGDQTVGHQIEAEQHCCCAHLTAGRKVLSVALCLRSSMFPIVLQEIAKVVISLGDVQHLDNELMNTVAEEVLPARKHEFHSVGLSNMVRACNGMGFYSTTMAKAAAGKL